MTMNKTVLGSFNYYETIMSNNVTAYYNKMWFSLQSSQLILSLAILFAYDSPVFIKKAPHYITTRYRCVLHFCSES
jgi:hypothetical protein